jgi:hypothetical protein
MSRGIDLDRAAAGWSMHEATGGDARMAVEIGYRMTRLRLEADHERLASTSRRRTSARLWLGRFLVAFGRFVEGPTPREEDCGGAVRV